MMGHSGEMMAVHSTMGSNRQSFVHVLDNEVMMKSILSLRGPNDQAYMDYKHMHYT